MLSYRELDMAGVVHWFGSHEFFLRREEKNYIKTRYNMIPDTFFLLSYSLMAFFDAFDSSGK